MPSVLKKNAIRKYSGEKNGKKIRKKQKVSKRKKHKVRALRRKLKKIGFLQFNYLQGGSFSNKQIIHLLFSNQNFQNLTKQLKEQKQKSSQKVKQRKKVRNKCNCKNSHCLKLYCECLKRNGYCGKKCTCKNCKNIPKFDNLRGFIISRICKGNPIVFQNKISDVMGRSIFQLGCNCKQNRCLKRYCQCFKNGANCSLLCECAGCMNNKVELNEEMLKGLIKQRIRYKK